MVGRFAPFLLALPLLALAACGGDDDDTPPTTGGNGSTAPASSGDFGENPNPAKDVPEDQRETVTVVPAGGDFFVGKNNFVFGILNRENQPQGGAKTRATFYDLSDPENPKPVYQAEAVASAPGVGEVFEHTHSTGEVHTHGGEDDDRGAYYVPVEFDRAGTWGVAVEVILEDGTRGVASTGFDVTEEPAVPAPGMEALASDNLTKADVTDIREIDSGDPANDMHDVKIKDAIAAGRPLVVVFSTPAYCTSQFCGPVNQEVETLHDKYKDRVDFVHIEIWRDIETETFNPTAREWLLRADGRMIEPYVYVIDREGTIYERWEGPVAANIMEPAVEAVAGGAVYGQ